MFNKKIIFLIIIVIIAAAGVLGYLEYKKNRVENPGGQTTGINTSDWLTYRNEEYGFELKYPGDWEVDSRSREKEFVHLKQKQDRAVFIDIGLTSKIYKDIPSPQECKILVGNVEGYIFCDDANFISDDDYKSGILVNFVNDDHVFQIYWYDQEHKNEKAYKDFKDIIKTLKFDK